MAVGVAILSGLMTGCATYIRATSERPVRCEPIEVVAWSEWARHALGRTGLFPFSAPYYAEAAAGEVREIYGRELRASGAFRYLDMVPHRISGDEEAIWWGRREGYDMVIVPSMVYMMDGSGALPTRLETRIRILDVRTGCILWDLGQKAFSVPGLDLDLYWNTISGAPAQRNRRLAEALAQQLTLYFKSSGRCQWKWIDK